MSFIKVIKNKSKIKNKKVHLEYTEKRKYVGAFFEKNQLQFSIAIVIVVLNAICQVGGSAYFLQKGMDIAVSGNWAELTTYLKFGFSYLAVLVLGWMIERTVKNRFLEKASRQYKEMVYDKLSEKSIRFFFREKTAAYISALTNDMTSIETNFLNGIFTSVLMGFYLITSVIAMLYYHKILTCVAVGSSIFSVLICTLFSGRLAQAEQRVSTANGAFIGIAEDILNGFGVIKSFQAQSHIRGLFVKANRHLEKVKKERRKTEASMNMIGQGLGMSAQFIVILIGAVLTMEDRVTAGVMLAFVQLMNFINTPVQMLPVAIGNMRAADTLITKTSRALSDNEGRKGQTPVHSLGQGIRMEHVNFGYEQGREILKDISFFFEAGKSYAIVGGSGSGKSTLLNLLMGGSDEYTGHIAINGTELREIAEESLYSILSVIWQNVFLFNSTIYDNITMFQNFPQEVVKSACEKAGLQHVIAAHGKDYLCGENGQGLSGGEKQRISIARSLLRNTPVLLMDEATAALDTQTAYQVENAILSIEGLTRIVVTHKLNPDLLRKYDTILVLSEGKIVESGDFMTLMSENGYFRALCQILTSVRQV